MAGSNRPLSPHLSVYRWGAHMAASIFHRATGAALAAGTLLVTWGLAAAATGPARYAQFQVTMATWPGRLVLFGFTWALLHHFLGGLRHLIMDTGAGYELKTNRMLAILTFVGSAVLTLLVWALGYGLI